MEQQHQPRQRIILILGMLMTISPFAIDMYLPAFGQIANDMGTSATRISLSVASYFVGLAFGQLMYGPMLDRFGRKKPLYIGLSMFMAASLGCMQSDSITSLVVFRFFQALGGCVAWVAAATMVRDFFSIRESSKIFSLLILV
ncbi:MAG: MFS transporter, partial [Bacteroidota bacterium]